MTIRFAAALLVAFPGAIALAHSPADHKVQMDHAEAQHAAAPGRPGDPNKASRSVHVAMDDNMRFSPSTIAVKRNETVRFVVTNKGKLTHEMVFGTMADLKSHAAIMRGSPAMQHDDPNAVTVAPGKTGTLVWQFTRTGNFDFACLQPGHFEAGMLGKVAVQ
jgi:uncharacterized cupredoxin-like copper-binding protein